MVIEVPRLKEVPTDVTPNLQDRLNCVTEVLSRVSKLVCEDLDKAVSSAVGHDKDGNPSVGSGGRGSGCRSLFGCSPASLCSPGSPQDKRPILAVVPSPAAPCHPSAKEGLSACTSITLLQGWKTQIYSGPKCKTWTLIFIEKNLFQVYQ